MTPTLSWSEVKMKDGRDGRIAGLLFLFLRKTVSLLTFSMRELKGGQNVRIRVDWCEIMRYESLSAHSKCRKSGDCCKSEKLDTNRERICLALPRYAASFETAHVDPPTNLFPTLRYFSAVRKLTSDNRPSSLPIIAHITRIPRHFPPPDLPLPIDREPTAVLPPIAALARGPQVDAVFHFLRVQGFHDVAVDHGGPAELADAPGCVEFAVRVGDQSVF